MDPLLLEALRFGVAILAGGIVAVIAQRIAFGNARRLQRDEEERHTAALRRALMSEIRENMQRLGGPEVQEGGGGAAVVRSAWDTARALPLPSDVFNAIALAYAYGAELERWVGVILGRVAYRGVAWKWGPETRARAEAVANSHKAAQMTYDAFAKALELLERSDA